MSLAQHIVIRPADGRPLFMDLSVRRLFTRVVVALGNSFAVACWGAGDNHAHAAIANDRAAAGDFARRLEVSLTLRLELSVGFAPAKIQPVRDQSHFDATITYVMNQHERHRLQCDPYHEGSSLPDAVGLRLLAPKLPAMLDRVAPRLDRRTWLPAAGPMPAPNDAAALARAGAAVIGRADLRGKQADVQAARRAVVELAKEATNGELAHALGCSKRTVARLRVASPPDTTMRQAIIGQARWRNGGQGRR